MILRPARLIAKAQKANNIPFPLDCHPAAFWDRILAVHLRCHLFSRRGPSPADAETAAAGMTKVLSFWLYSK